MEEAEMQQLVGHPEYHSVCLGFWHAAQTRGVDAMRNLPSEAIANSICEIVNLPKDRKTRHYVLRASDSWLREEHNFWGMVFQDEGGMVWSADFVQANLLKGLPRELQRVRHNFPVRGTLCLRSPLPPTVLLDETEELCPMFVIADTCLALSFSQAIVFKPEFSVQLPGRLEDGRTVDRAVFGWPTVLASEGEREWRKLMPQAAVARERIVACADKENLLAELEDVESSTSREQGNG